MPFAVLTQKDGIEKSQKRIQLKAETPANATALATAINAVTGGSVRKVDYSTNVSEVTGFGTGNLGRESVIRFTDGSGNLVAFRLRGIENEYFLTGGALDVNNEDIIALGTAITTYALLSDGEAVLTLHSGEAVG